MSAHASMGMASDAELANAVIRAGVAGSPLEEAELCRRWLTDRHARSAFGRTGNEGAGSLRARVLFSAPPRSLG